MLKPKNKKEDKIKLTKESYSKAFGIFRYLKPYGFIYFIGWIFLVLSTSAGLVFPYLLGKLLGTSSATNMQDSVELITDGNYSVIKYYLRYLRKPATVVLSPAVNCDLPEHTHDEIVKLAANMTLENIEQPRYKSHINELNKVE
jgi:ABC-type multidrug transport system fused ATPase/permease subunit